MKGFVSEGMREPTLHRAVLQRDGRRREEVKGRRDRFQSGRSLIHCFPGFSYNLVVLNNACIDRCINVGIVLHPAIAK